jgi:ABC-2 type transport system permease protein
MKDSGMQELVDTKMGAMPPALLEAFNLAEAPDFSKLNQYFAYVFQYIVMAGYIYAGILGARSLSKEESEGTIEFLYAQPVSRTTIVTMKFFSSLALLYLFFIIMAIASIIISIIVKPVNLEIITIVTDIKLMFSGLFLVGLVFLCIGFLSSVLITNVKMAMPLSIGFFFVTYLLGVFSGMIDKLEFLKYFSPFHYAIPSEIIMKGIQGTNIILATIICLVSIFITYFIYRKKDFRI